MYYICFDQIYYYDYDEEGNRILVPLIPHVAWYVGLSLVDTRCNFRIIKTTNPLSTGKSFPSDEIANAWFEDNKKVVYNLLNELFDYDSVRIIEADINPKKQVRLSFNMKKKSINVKVVENEKDVDETWLFNFNKEYDSVYEEVINWVREDTDDDSFYISEEAYDQYGKQVLWMHSLHRDFDKNVKLDLLDFYYYLDRVKASRGLDDDV